MQVFQQKKHQKIVSVYVISVFPVLMSIRRIYKGGRSTQNYQKAIVEKRERYGRVEVRDRGRDEINRSPLPKGLPLF